MKVIVEFEIDDNEDVDHVAYAIRYNFPEWMQYDRGYKTKNIKVEIRKTYGD